jgi:hypothetical protein
MRNYAWSVPLRTPDQERQLLYLARPLIYSRSIPPSAVITRLLSRACHTRTMVRGHARAYRAPCDTALRARDPRYQTTTLIKDLNRFRLPTNTDNLVFLRYTSPTTIGGSRFSHIGITIALRISGDRMCGRVAALEKVKRRFVTTETGAFSPSQLCS